MQRTFRDHVDTLQREGDELGATFARRRVRYLVPAAPEDLATTLQAAKQRGFLVAVTYDVDTLVISDVVRA